MMKKTPEKVLGPVQLRIDRDHEHGCYSAWLCATGDMDDRLACIGTVNAPMADELPGMMKAWKKFLEVTVTEMYASCGMEVASINVFLGAEMN